MDRPAVVELTRWISSLDLMEPSERPKPFSTEWKEALQKFRRELRVLTGGSPEGEFLALEVYDAANRPQGHLHALDLADDAVLKEFFRPVAGEKDGRCFSPCVLRDGHRRGVSVHAMTALALDLDDMTPASYAALRAHLEGLGLRAIVYETYSHTTERPKARLVLPFREEWRVSSPEAWRALHGRLVAHLNLPGGCAHDKRCEDPSHFYHLPRHPEGQTREVRLYTGEFLDWRSVEASAAPVTPTHTAATTAAVEGAEAFGPASPEVLAAAEAHLADYRTANPTGPGTGNADAVAVGSILLGDWALTFDEALPLARTHNERTHNPRSEDELETCLENGDRYAKGERGAKRKELVSKRKFLERLQRRPREAARVVISLAELDGERLTARVLEELAKHEDLYARPVGLSTVIEPRDGDAPPKLRLETRDLLAERIAGTVRLVAPAAGRGEDRTKAPPAWLLGALLDRGHWPGVRELDAVAGAPVLRPDGSIFHGPGYDAQTRVYVARGACKVEVPERPSLDDAARAVQVLEELVSDFPFADASARAAWLAALLTLVGRRAFDGPTPLFLMSASTAGSGKSLLTDLISEIATGGAMARQPLPQDDAEFRKNLTAIALDGPSAVCFDNLPNGGLLKSAALDAALTAEVWRDRILGQSKTVALPWRTVLFANGNNVGVGGDLHRRVLLVRLEPNQERPEERTGFRHDDLMGWTREHRAELLGAATTVLSGYLRGGAPKQVGGTFGSFEGWSRAVRGALVWAGAADPLETRKTVREFSETSNGLAELHAALLRLGESTAARLLRDDDARGACAELLGAREEMMTPRRIGYALRTAKGKVLDGCRVSLRRKERGDVWLLEPVEGGSLPTPPPGGDPGPWPMAGPSATLPRGLTSLRTSKKN